MTQIHKVLDSIFKEDFLKEFKIENTMLDWNDIKDLARKNSCYVTNTIERDLIKQSLDREAVKQYQNERREKINDLKQNLQQFKCLDGVGEELVLTQCLILATQLEIQYVKNGYLSSNKLETLQIKLKDSEQQFTISINQTKNVGSVISQLQFNLKLLNPFNINLLKKNNRITTPTVRGRKELKNVLIIGANKQDRNQFISNILSLVSNPKSLESIYSSSYSSEDCQEQDLLFQTVLTYKIPKTNICLIETPQLLKQQQPEQQYINKQIMSDILANIQSFRIIVLIEQQSTLIPHGVLNFIQRLNKLFPDYLSIKNSTSFIFYDFKKAVLTQFIQQCKKISQQTVKNKNIKQILINLREKISERDIIQVYLSGENDCLQCKRLLKFLAIQPYNSNTNCFDLNLSTKSKKSIDDKFSIVNKNIIKYFNQNKLKASKYYLQQLEYLSKCIIVQNGHDVEKIKSELTDTLRFRINDWLLKIRQSVSKLSLCEKESYGCSKYFKQLETSKEQFKKYLKKESIDESIKQFKQSLQKIVVKMLNIEFDETNVQKANQTAINLRLIANIFDFQLLKQKIIKQNSTLVERFKQNLQNENYLKAKNCYNKYKIINSFELENQDRNSSLNQISYILQSYINSLILVQFQTFNKTSTDPISLQCQNLQKISLLLFASNKIKSSPLFQLLSQNTSKDIEENIIKFQSIIRQYVAISFDKGYYCIRSLSYVPSVLKGKLKTQSINNITKSFKLIFQAKINIQTLEPENKLKNEINNYKQSESSSLKQRLLQLIENPFKSPDKLVEKIIIFMSNIQSIQTKSNQINEQIIYDIIELIDKFIQSAIKFLTKIQNQSIQNSLDLNQTFDNLNSLSFSARLLRQNQTIRNQISDLNEIQIKINRIVLNAVQSIARLQGNIKTMSVHKLQHSYKAIVIFSNTLKQYQIYQKIVSLKQNYQSYFKQLDLQFKQIQLTLKQLKQHQQQVDRNQMRRIKQLIVMMKEIQTTKYLSSQLFDMDLFLIKINKQLFEIFCDYERIEDKDGERQSIKELNKNINNLTALSQLDNITGSSIGCFQKLSQKFKQIRKIQITRIKKQVQFCLDQSHFQKLNELLLKVQQKYLLEQVCDDLQAFIKTTINQLNNERIKVIYQKSFTPIFIQKIEKFAKLSQKLIVKFIDYNNKDLSKQVQAQIQKLRHLISYIFNEMKNIIQSNIEYCYFDKAFNHYEKYRIQYSLFSPSLLTGIESQSEVFKYIISRIKQIKNIFNQLVEENFKYLKYYKTIMKNQIINAQIQSLREHIKSSIESKVEQMVSKYKNQQINYQQFVKWNSYLEQQFRQSVIEKHQQVNQQIESIFPTQNIQISIQTTPQIKPQLNQQIRKSVRTFKMLQQQQQ